MKLYGFSMKPKQPTSKEEVMEKVKDFVHFKALQCGWNINYKIKEINQEKLETGLIKYFFEVHGEYND